jgi:eukaryotic-like serine/threonine-protein kinase
MPNDPSSLVNLVPSQWYRLKEILADALEENSLERRATTLRESCAGDATLLRQAETLLAGDTDTLEQFAEFAATRLRSDEPGRMGERVGAYIIIRQLGRGGMGTVYLGERADGQFEKQVAVKILKRGTDTDEVLRRFAVERRILAKLDHPNITRLLDAGTTQDGLPYFIMDYMEGVPITEFAHKQNLSFAHRLHLFLKVCFAVEFAHRNGVIHRDIKATNILVKSNGEPKLLDFGIAKMLGSPDDDVTSPVERRITPRYAAPELSRFEPVTPAADVYSLGLVLLELITDENVPGETRAKTVSQTEMQDSVDPALAAIVRRATQTEPGNRYPSAAELGNAIEQLSSDAARRKSAKLFQADSTRARQFRWLLVAAPLLLVVIAAGLLLRDSGGWPSRLTENPRPPTSASSISDGTRLMAVLPFKPLGHDINDELLGLGMADAVIGQMSKVKAIRVLPTSAVLRLKREAEDPLLAARTLNADAVLTGTVQRSGDRIRVSVQLVDGRTGRALSSDKFDETFTNVFAIQDSISSQITKALAIDLTADQRKQIAKRYTKRTDAYNAYLMGLHFYNKRSKEGLEKAIDYFSQATQLDPDYALAYALLADCYCLQAYYTFVPVSQATNNGKTAVERALLLDDSVAEAHVAMAMAQGFEGDYRGSMKSLQRALELNPNLAVAHLRYAWELTDAGRLSEAVPEMKRAQELDPISATNNTALGVILIFDRQFEQALFYSSRAGELEPDNPAIQGNIAVAYLLNGSYDSAIKAYRKQIELAPDQNGKGLAAITEVLYHANRRAEADALMPEVLRLAVNGEVDAFSIVGIYTASGELDHAFEWFDKALSDDMLLPRFIRYGPELDTMRTDPRFVELLRKHGRKMLADQLSAH